MASFRRCLPEGYQELMAMRSGIRKKIFDPSCRVRPTWRHDDGNGMRKAVCSQAAVAKLQDRK